MGVEEGKEAALRRVVVLHGSCCYVTRTRRYLYSGVFPFASTRLAQLQKKLGWFWRARGSYRGMYLKTKASFEKGGNLLSC